MMLAKDTYLSSRSLSVVLAALVWLSFSPIKSPHLRSLNTRRSARPTPLKNIKKQSSVIMQTRTSAALSAVSNRDTSYGAWRLALRERREQMRDSDLWLYGEIVQFTSTAYANAGMPSLLFVDFRERWWEVQMHFENATRQFKVFSNESCRDHPTCALPSGILLFYGGAVTGTSAQPGHHGTILYSTGSLLIVPSGHHWHAVN